MQIGDLLKNRAVRTKPPPHELADIVNEIEKVVGFTKQYGRGYWLGQVSRWHKRTGKAYPVIFGILKEISQADPKYNKGGILTNKLRK